MSQIFVLVGQSSLQTLEMVFFSTLFSLVLGFPVGVLLYITNPTGISPRPILNQVLSRIVNVLRSFPFIILMIAFSAFTPYVGDKHWNRSYDYPA